MRPNRLALLISCLILLGSMACTLPAPLGKPSPTPSPRPHPKNTPTPQPAALASPTSEAAAAAPTSAATTAPSPGALSDFCSDSQISVLIGNFKAAALTSNGPLLASLVSPAHGMDARYYRTGRVVNYDAAHAKFLFTSTFVVDWGPAPGSGLETTGSFHELFVPALADVFNRAYTLDCNQIQVGGTTYKAAWPYPGVNFYSAYYSGTPANGNMDWHTWLLGFDYSGSKPYLYAIMQFQWEP